MNIYASDGELEGIYISTGDTFDYSIDTEQTLVFDDGNIVIDLSAGDTITVYFADYQNNEVMPNTFTENDMETSNAVTYIDTDFTDADSNSAWEFVNSNTII